MRIAAGVSAPDVELVYELPCFSCRQPFMNSSERPHMKCERCRPQRRKEQTMALDKQTVIDALDVDAVLAHYGIRALPRGRWKRARQCPARGDHGTETFGISPDGKWHCHACQTGGDLLKLIAVAENIDPSTGFPKVLEVAAKIAGVVEGQAAPVRRPAPSPGPTLEQRIATARKRAEWLWPRAQTKSIMGAGYLRDRGIDAAALIERGVEIRFGPIAMTPDEVEQSDGTRTVARIYRAYPSIMLPVRTLDGTLCDVRRRALDAAWLQADGAWPAHMTPTPDTPKVIGMPGNVTRDGDELIGCYGRPDLVEGERDIVVCEGWADFLTCEQVWGQQANVLGAVDAGQIPLVAAFAAARAAETGIARVILVAQNDPPRKDERTGQMIDGAATRAADDARARCLRRLPLDKVPLVLCAPHKDANDILQAEGALGLYRRLADAEIDEEW